MTHELQSFSHSLFTIGFFSLDYLGDPGLPQATKGPKTNVRQTPRGCAEGGTDTEALQNKQRVHRVQCTTLGQHSDSQQKTHSIQLLG